MSLTLPNTPTIPGKRIELRNSHWATLALDAALSDEGFFTYGYLNKDADRAKLDRSRHQREADGTGRYWAIVAVPDDIIVGLAEAHVFNAQSYVIELAYWVAPQCRCKGIATEALKLLTRWVETDTQAARVDLPIHPEHHASIKVAKKAGYEHRSRVPLLHPIGGQYCAELYSWSRDTA
jgi:RimJ/RimL family protein N-acetyltransferase